MIVRMDSDVLRRCLENVGHLCDAYYILDTRLEGEEYMKDTVEKVMGPKNVPGEVGEDPWDDDFGRSRTLAIRRAEKWLKGRGEILSDWYLMFMDADNHLHINGEPQDKFDGEKFYLTDEMRLNLNADRYQVDMKSGSTSYAYAWMVSLRRTWKWEYPLHEYVTTDDKDIKSGKINGCYIWSAREGFRSKNDDKYLRDANVFKKYLETHPDDARATFYLGQSLRDYTQQINKFILEVTKKIQDAKDEELEGLNKELEEHKKNYEAITEEAADAYEKRGNMEGTFAEERYSSYVEAAKLRVQDLDKNDIDKIFAMLGRAVDICNWRLEAPYYYIRICRHKKYYGQGYRYGLGFLDIKKEDVAKKSILFMENHIYDSAFLDELSVCSFYAGDHSLAFKLMSACVVYEPERISKNMAFFKDMPKEIWHPLYTGK